MSKSSWNKAPTLSYTGSRHTWKLHKNPCGWWRYFAAFLINGSNKMADGSVSTSDGSPRVFAMDRTELTGTERGVLIYAVAWSDKPCFVCRERLYEIGILCNQLIE